MKQLNIEVYKIAEKKPGDGQECWVLSPTSGNRYPHLQVYNEYHECWDDAEGDDFDFSVSDDDIWMPLPSKAEMEKKIL